VPPAQVQAPSVWSALQTWAPVRPSVHVHATLAPTVQPDGALELPPQPSQVRPLATTTIAPRPRILFFVCRVSEMINLRTTNFITAAARNYATDPRENVVATTTQRPAPATSVHSFARA
jgi:hypothetical protein